MKCSKISWAASFDLRLKVYQAANVDHDILFPVAILRKMQAHFVGLQAAFGASFASIATSSPMEVRTMTSENISEHHTFERKVRLTGVFLVGAEELLDLFANLSLRNLDIFLGIAIVSHERQKAVVSDIQLMSCQ